MKKFKLNLAYLAIFAMIFASCSKEETGGQITDAEKATISFGAIVNDIVNNRAASKQAIGDMPECSDSDPAYVRVVLLNGATPVLGTNANPYRINLVGGEVFTVEDPNLELDPDTYTLDHFSVYNAANQLIWLAPRGGALADFVDNPLPLDIDLRAGVKKYVEVDVLCYDNRDVVEYGYLFFEIDTNEAIKFCIFGNYCPPSGRHFPASYSVDIWSGTNSSGEVLYSDVYNVTGTNADGDFFAEPLCFALPDTEGLDEYYFEITLRSTDEYGQVQERVIRRGAINDDIVRTFFDGDNNLDYYHFRQGCDGDDTPPVFENPEDEGELYKTCLYPLNDSNAVALAYFQLENNVLKTTILAAGFEPNEVHAQHIHGFTDGSNATCPPESADTDDNGIISLQEGAPYYGGVLLALQNEDGSYPVADAWGNYIYQRTFNIGSLSLPDLEKLAVVAHGLEVNGTYEPSIPIACGQVSNLD